jgi:hypothetical protein
LSAGAAIALAAALASAGAAGSQAFVPPDPAARVAHDASGWRVTDASCPVLPADASLRQRIVDVAAEEWARFRYQVLEVREDGLSVVVRPERGSIIPRALNRVRPGITPRLLRLGHMEGDGSVAAAIAGYWAATPDSHGIELQNQLEKVYDETGWAVYWSAAFISYVMCASGAGDPAQFHRSEAHWRYVDQAIEAADGKAPRAMFRARDLDQGLPRPGDLVCLDRTGGRFRSTDDKRRAPGEAPLHCDVVVKVDARRRLAAMIGGNVVQSVSMSLVDIVPARHGRPARLEMRGDRPGARPFFTVLELTTGGEASLDKAPAIRRIGRP